MRGYTQLTREERYQISVLIKAGHNQSEIATALGRNKSTISRELKRNRGLRGYRPQQAQRLAQERRQAKVKPRLDQAVWIWVERLLREDWSPKQISLWLAKEKRIFMSHERIYQYVLEDKRQGGNLHQDLRCQKPLRKRYGSYDRRSTIPNQTSIEQRPAIVDTRKQIGDWEANTIIGKNHSSVLVSLTERKSRLALITKLPSVKGDGGIKY